MPNDKSPVSALPSMTAAMRAPVIVRPKDAVLALVLIFVWLIPIVMVGGFKREVSFLPAFVRNQHRCACLFTHRVSSWRTYHIEVQQGGDDVWRELPEEGYFDMTVFGHRSRFHRILSHAWGRPGEKRRTDDVARYINTRHRQREPSAPQIDAIRFVRVTHGIEGLANEGGQFTKPTLDLVDARRKSVTGELRFDGKSPMSPRKLIRQKTEHRRRPFR